MSTSTLFRLSGLAGILSGLFIVIDFLQPAGLVVDTVGVLSAVLGLFLLTGYTCGKGQRAKVRGG